VSKRNVITPDGSKPKHLCRLCPPEPETRFKKQRHLLAHRRKAHRTYGL